MLSAGVAPRSPRASCSSATTPGTPTCRVERYLRRCELKTARAFEAACELGALHGRRRRRRAGRRSAAASASPSSCSTTCSTSPGPAERTGKPRGTDLLDGTVTLPLILARERDPELARLDLRALRTPEDAEEVCDRIAATGALEARAGRRWSGGEAKAALPDAAGTRSARALELVADGVVERYA